MRLAYAFRNIRPAPTDSTCSYVRAMAILMAEIGHDVVVVTETPALRLESLTDAGVRVVTPVPAAPDWWYLSPHHQYADRVSRTLEELDAPVDVIEAPVTGAESFTVVRARRMLGQKGPPVVARLTARPTPASPLSFHEDVRRFAENYVLRHCDAISLPVGKGSGGRTWGMWPTPLGVDALARTRITSPVRRVVFVGELSQRGGVEDFLATTELLPSFDVEVAGHDTATDPFGRSYAASLEFPVTILNESRDLDEVLAKPAILLFPDLSVAPTELMDAAMARGGVIIGGGTSPHPNVLAVADRSPEALANAVQSWSERPEDLETHSRTVRRDVRNRCHPRVVAKAAERLYAAVCERPPLRRRVSATPRVSVVIPLYNQGAFVREAVDAARAGGRGSIEVEIVVVDDGSTDDHTRRVFDELHEVVKVRQENLGLAAARNAGILASTGEFVVPLDADDLISDDFMAKALRAISHDTSLSYVSCYSRNFGLFDGVFAPLGNVASLMPFLHTDGRCTGLYRRSALDQVGGYAEDMPAYEDWDLQIRMHRAGMLGDIIPEVLFFYRRHVNSLVFRHSNAARVELIQHLVRKHADLLEHQGSDVILKLVHLWLTRFEASESMRFLGASGL